VRDNHGVSATSRSVLVVDPTALVPEAFAAALRLRGYYAETFASGKDALDLACTLPFDVVVVVVEGLDTSFRDFIRRMRQHDSASHETTLLALAGGPAMLPARDLLGRGVNRVLAADVGAEDLARAIMELVESSPRVPLKAVIRFRLQRGADQAIAMCQTEDVSATGAFVRTEMAPAAGTQIQFELTVPGQVEPIRGTAEVARLVAGRPGQAPGIGLRFLHMEGEGGDRLRWLLESRSPRH
jgi:uncharacterized protein (TIGR02266 family)